MIFYIVIPAAAKLQSRNPENCFFRATNRQNVGMRERLFQPAVYILASQRNGTLYTGVTSDLVRRIYEHREGMVPGFTRKYGVKLLVWFEMHATMEHAIVRETRIKGWKRAWKLELIEAANPDWRDLYETLL